MCTSLDLALLLAALVAFGLTAADAFATRLTTQRRITAVSVGAPYRIAPGAELLRARGSAPTLVAVGSALWAVTAIVSLTTALVQLRWEGIGVALLPAIAIALGRIYGARVAMRERDLTPLQLVTTAALVLDVPLIVFSVAHLALGDAHHGGEEMSLATVAAAYALLDGLHAALARASRSPA